MGFVMDVPVEVTVELGRKSAKIGEILRLGPGSVIELSKANGEPLDIYVNNRLIAQGEAVVIGERYGVRLTDVVVSEDTRRGGG
jgi:flagellar motor switch protein FliN/FliY